MLRSVTITGAVGRLTWGYHEAAALAQYTITKSEEGIWHVAARIVSANSYRIAQRPLAFEAPHTGGIWKWPIEELLITGEALTARLGPREGTPS